MRHPRSARHGQQRAQRGARGLSIVELMVGLVVSLLVGLAASVSAISFTASQRQGMSAGSSATSAGAALSTLKNDIAAAGLGFFGDSRFLCNRLNLSRNGTLHVDGALFSPVLITAGSSGDRIDVVHATQVAAGTNVLLQSASNGTSAEVRSLLPVAVGQAVLLAPDTPSATNPCVVRTVTAITASTDELPQSLTFANSGTYNQVAFTTNGSYVDKSRVTLLGDLRWSRYRLNGTDLLIEQPLNGVSEVLARNVIGLRAQYGVSAAAAGSTTLDSWEDAAGTFATVNAANLPRVRALRVGIVIRSAQPEKKNGSGQCEASTAKPQLFGATVQPDVSDWQCYRYRSTEVVVPMRNLVLGVK
ncbi:MAG TPA: PilW family protein [Rubrivivax sp.]|nr:PilW family protein [Rubrivivax sp.]